MRRGKMKGKSTILSFCMMVFAGTAAFSLPGFEPFIRDAPGEYVYYEDRTFARKSYVGFLSYDEKTYAARYFAPADKSKKKPELEVSIYFTIDASKNFIELTGEKIVSARTPDDTEIINYMHDMVYELNARRIKAGDVSPGVEYSEGVQFLDGGIRKDDDFMQFGGEVVLVYDYLVPLFNIKAIESPSGLPLFYAITAGRIVSSSDTSFEDFKGFPEKYADTKHKFKRDKRALPSNWSYGENLTVHLDSMWRQSMENLWLCQDVAFLSAGVLSQGHANLSGNGVSPFILRQLLQSVGNSYVDLRTVVLKNDAASTLISAVFFQSTAKTVTESIRHIQKSGGTLYFVSLNVFKNVYDKNKDYFDEILARVEIQ